MTIWSLIRKKRVAIFAWVALGLVALLFLLMGRRFLGESHIHGGLRPRLAIYPALLRGSNVTKRPAKAHSKRRFGVRKRLAIRLHRSD